MTCLVVAWVMFKYTAVYVAVVLTLSYVNFVNITPTEENE